MSSRNCDIMLLTSTVFVTLSHSRKQWWPRNSHSGLPWETHLFLPRIETTSNVCQRKQNFTTICTRWVIYCTTAFWLLCLTDSLRWSQDNVTTVESFFGGGGHSDKLIVTPIESTRIIKHATIFKQCIMLNCTLTTKRFSRLIGYFGGHLLVHFQ